MDYCNTDVYFPPAVLKKLVTDRYSAVKVIKNYTGHVQLLPFHLGFLKEAISSQLQAKVGNYDHRLDGVILGFTKVKVIDCPGLGDSPDFVLSYIADVYIFSPTIGQVIKGVVNQVSKEHVGVLVHGAFNASLSDVRSHRLRRLGDRPGLGTTVEFTISAIKFTDHLIAIEGPLPILYEDKIFSTEDESEKTDLEDIQLERVSMKQGPVAGPSHKDKKRRRKKIILDNEENSENIGWDSGIASGAEPSDISPLRLEFDQSMMAQFSQEKPAEEKKDKKKRKSKDITKEETLEAQSVGIKAEPQPQIKTEHTKENKKRKQDIISIKVEPLSDAEPSVSSHKIDDEPTISNENESTVKDKKKKSKKKHSLDSGVDDASNVQLNEELPLRIKEEPTTPEQFSKKRKRDELQDVPRIKMEPMSDVEATPTEPKKKRKKYEENAGGDFTGSEKKLKKKKKSLNMDAVSEQLLAEITQSKSL